MTTIPPNAPSRLPRATGLRRFARPDGTVSAAAGQGAGEAAERCGMCGENLGREHAHLADLQQRSIDCACTACALLFTRPGGRYRTVPDRVRVDPAAPLTGAEWAELSIPVAIAFFFVHSELGRVVASYPSPAGVTECELDLAAWDRLAEAHPLLRAPEADIEAILVVAGGAPGAASDASGTPGVEAFLVPIDVCYSLAGALRLDWHGFDGGPEVRRILSGRLNDLRERARPLAAAPG
jgi:hypothetical protein